MKLRIPLILGSSSPRRKELLESIGIEPTKIVSPDIDETVHHLEGRPLETVRAISEAKAKHLAATLEEAETHAILTADTFVYARRQIMGKAHTDEDVRHFLKTLSGRRHRVYSGITLITPNHNAVTKTVTTIVQFKRLTLQEIEWYVSTGDGIGKAGGYAIQGPASVFVKHLNGSHTSVVGLPVHETVQLLHGQGVLQFQQTSPFSKPQNKLVTE